MKQLLFTLVFTTICTVALAQMPIEPQVQPNKTKTTTTVKKKKAPVKVNNSCYIIVFRGGQFASSLTNYSIYIDGVRVCKLSNAKYFKYPVSPGKHEIEAKKAGLDIMKKQTFTSVVSLAGNNNYIACNIKSSILRERIEMSEVVASSGRQSLKDLKEDNCQDDIETNRKH